MKLKNPILLKAVGLGTSIAVRFYRRTIDWQGVFFEPPIYPLHPRRLGRCIYCCWHECMFMPIALHGHHRMLALASEHSDGEISTRAMRHLGWSVTRGSTTRGGAKALLRLLRDRDCSPTITPDGPRGPRRQMSLGPIVLSSKLGLPLVCVGYGYHRPWRLRSWDRFALPRPLSRGRAVYGPAMIVPPHLGREQLEQYRLWFEDLLNWLTWEAETWAESGRPKAGSMALRPKETPRAMWRDAPPAFELPLSLRESWAAISRGPFSETRIAA